MMWPPMGRTEDPIALLKILSGYPPGRAGERVTRGLGMKMTPVYAKAAIVDAMPGAAGRLAMEAIKGAPTDAVRCL